MGALPKNKITRAERGKRRKGNTPKIKVQHPDHILMPLAKKTLFGKFLELVGSTKPISAKAKADTVPANSKIKKSKVSAKAVLPTSDEISATDARQLGRTQVSAKQSVIVNQKTKNSSKV